MAVDRPGPAAAFAFFHAANASAASMQRAKRHQRGRPGRGGQAPACLGSGSSDSDSSTASTAIVPRPSAADVAADAAVSAPPNPASLQLAAHAAADHTSSLLDASEACHQDAAAGGSHVEVGPPQQQQQQREEAAAAARPAASTGGGGAAPPAPSAEAARPATWAQKKAGGKSLARDPGNARARTLSKPQPRRTAEEEHEWVLRSTARARARGALSRHDRQTLSVCRRHSAHCMHARCAHSRSRKCADGLRMVGTPRVGHGRARNARPTDPPLLLLSSCAWAPRRAGGACRPRSTCCSCR